MALAWHLQVGLKEWATVCAALESGRQIILLRKGGISESIGGFEIEHRQFLLFPTYLHQQAAMLKPAERAGLSPTDAEPRLVRISSAAMITDIVQMPSRAVMDSLDDEHIWAPPLIDMRFNYRPKNPLYLLLIRAYRLADPVTIENSLEYAGCKSWVPLRAGISTIGATPALDDLEFEKRRKEILHRVNFPAGEAPK
ncbi:MAG: DUF1802 family protein [Tepidisphaeraceae bacterium]|jgi:hypothetical protein